MKNTKDRRIWRSRALAILLLAPLAFSLCENRHPEMDITMETDFSEIIAAINSANKSLSDKLALIEASLQQGLADNQAAMEQVRQAVASLSGTMEEKLAVVEASRSSFMWLWSSTSPRPKQNFSSGISLKNGR